MRDWRGVKINPSRLLPSPRRLIGTVDVKRTRLILRPAARDQITRPRVLLPTTAAVSSSSGRKSRRDVTKTRRAGW